MDPLNLSKLNDARRSRKAVILATEIETGRDRVINEGDAIPGELGSLVEKAFRSGKSGIVEAAGTEFFLNVHLPPPRLVIIGAVHISQALVPMAALTGFDTTIIDPRTAFATPERFEGVRLLAEWPEEVLELDAYTALAAVTHDPKIDDLPLSRALEAGCFYVGALGSRKTHAKRIDRLAQAGIGPELTGRIHAPIGLDIGASSPAEIAVAIMAEIVGALRKRDLDRSTTADAAE